MRHLILLSILVFVAGCTPRATIVYAPNLGIAENTRTVFVSTTRQRDGFVLSTRRASNPSYLRYDLSVPVNRAPGAIDWPKRGIIDPNTQFFAVGQMAYPDGNSFVADLRRALQERPLADREAVIYVHGFNNTFDEGVLRITQLSEDFDLPGVALHYSWPSAGHPLGYAYDRDSLLIARDGLESLIAKAQQAGASRIILVAHSVGSMLVMETLRQISIAKPGSVPRVIDGVILISPDLDIQLFHAQAARIGRLPNPFGIFVSKRDRVLNLSARLTGQRNRLGNVSDVNSLSGLNVTVVDVSEFSTGTGHFTAGSSSAVIAIFSRAGALEAAFAGDSAGRAGLLPGTVLTVQNATNIILSPGALRRNSVQ